MFVSQPFHISSSGQTDDRFSIPLPMVYEQAPVTLPRWEYRVLAIDSREEALPDATQLNEMGNEGWVLVGVLDQRASGGRPTVLYYFLRQKLS